MAHIFMVIKKMCFQAKDMIWNHLVENKKIEQITTRSLLIMTLPVIFPFLDY